jgi:hypothetical protein
MTVDGRMWISHKWQLSAGYEDAAEQIRLLADKKTELPQ